LQKCNTTFVVYNVDVPFAKRNSQRYLEKLQELENTLNNSEEIESACVHEAGHLLYFAKLGVTKPYLQVPRIFPRGSGFDYRIAAVGTERQQTSASDARKLIRVTRALAAGGVFLRELKHLPDGRDSDDYDNFVDYCLQYQGKFPKPFNKGKLWRKARKHVERELQRDSKLRIRAEQTIGFLKRLFFFRVIA
jgi:hypothetical protein